MKKVISILAIMMIISCAVFAATNDKLNVTAKVVEAKPDFKIYGGTTSTAVTVEGTQSGATVATDTDISSSNAVVYLKVTQPAKSKYKGTVTLTITPSELENTDSELKAANKTGIPTVAGLTAGSTSLATNNYSVDPSSTAATGVVSLPITYNGKPVAASAAVVIATWNYTWAKDENLAVGSYQATITLTYTVS